MVPARLCANTAVSRHAPGCMSLAQTLGGYIGPYSTAVWLALGMTGVDFATHVRRTLPWAWLLVLMVMASAWLLPVW